MRWLVLIILSVGCFSPLLAQNLNGKWVGYFTPNTDLDGRTFTYEIDIQASSSNELNAITVTKFSNHNTAKAIANGLYNMQTKLVSIHESKFEQLQLDPNMQACLMSNYLTYLNIRGHEILQGTYMSSNISNGKDCGGGTVFLEKVDDVVKTFTQKNNTNKKIIQSVVSKQNTASVKNATIPATKNTTIPLANLAAKPNAQTNTITTTNSAPGKLNPVVINTIPAESKRSTTILPDEDLTEDKELDNPKKTTEFQVIPWVLVGRENKLVKKIITHNKTISIDLYDNGTIDNDTIIVYDNKQLIVNKKRLSYKAIHFDLNFSTTNNEHEIIIVAHNMGTVPPNTALLVYKDSLLRQELFITSTNKMNAKLIIVYEPPKENPN